MAKILEIIKDFNVKIALKNIFTKIDEIIRNLSDKEDYITPGTTSQYWRGDKTWQEFPVYEAVGSLTSAQINGLNTTPIVLLGSAGADKHYVIESTSFYYIAGTTGFTITGNVKLGYVTANVTILEPVSNSTMTGTTSQIENIYSANKVFSTAIINDSIRLTSGAISGGDGTINYSIKYRIVTTS